MFFILLCVLIFILLSTKHTPDLYGWVMLMGVAWLAGYLDCRRFAKSDQEKSRVMPPDVTADTMDDSSIFKS